MRTELIRDLLWHLEANNALQLGNADERTTENLESLDIPMKLRRVLQWHWTTSGGEVGPYTLYPVHEILKDEYFEQLFKFAMLPIGYAMNGDILVIRFQGEGCCVGLVSHDQLWEGETDPDAAFVEIVGSVEEYLWRSVERRYLPTDYYSAIELDNLKEEIAKNGLP
jgi:hypothetical protein